MSAEPRTLADVGRLVASKALTSEAVTERCLERITEQNRTLNAFVSVLDDDAVAQAKKADQEIAAGRYRGPLHGIPISLKDIIDLRNAPTTAASRVRDGHIARRDATVVHPPVDVLAFDPDQPRGDHYLLLGQLVRYKRADLAVLAFNELGLPLTVIGEGEQMAELQRLARPNVRMVGRQPFEVIRQQLQSCRALVFPGVEDFGIVPVEAMAAGAPVIAYARGGARETVRDGITGVWFDEQSVDALKVAVRRIESGALRFDPQVLHRHALAFDRARFLLEMQALIQRALREASAGVALAKPPVVFGHADVDEATVQRGRAHGTGRDQAREHVRLE